MGGKNSYESIKRYEDKAYDKVLLRMPKGRKAEIQSHAEAHGQSVNGFINRAIDHEMERDAAGGPSESTEACLEAGVVSFLPSDALKAAQEAAEAAGEDLPQFVIRAISETVERQKEASK